MSKNNKNKRNMKLKKLKKELPIYIGRFSKKEGFGFVDSIQEEDKKRVKGLEELSAFLKNEKYNVQNIKDLKESMYIHNNGFLTAADRRYCTCKKERCRLWWCKYRRKNYFCCTKKEK